jgi:hypothetical protein
MKPNDILYAAWGYDQTNIDFYKVLKVTDNFVSVIQIEQTDTYDPGLSMTGTTMPKPESPIVGKKPLRRKIHWFAGGAIPYLKITAYSYAYPWDGTPKHYSTYA